MALLIDVDGKNSPLNMAFCAARLFVKSKKTGVKSVRICVRRVPADIEVAGPGGFPVT